MRRVLLGSCLGVAIGLLIAASAAAARSKPVEHCGGRVLTTRYGVTLAASRMFVTTTTYTRHSARRIRPLLSCQQARGVANAYFRAKLYRPLGHCTVPAVKGEWCHVDGWLCSAEVPNAPSPSEQECVHELIDRTGFLRRLTYVYFRETDNDNA